MNIETIRAIFRDAGLYHLAADDRLCERLLAVATHAYARGYDRAFERILGKLEGDNVPIR